MERPLKNGAWLDTDGTIHMAYRGMDVPVMHRDNISIIGGHNVENYLAAISAVWGYVSAETIRKVAKEFMGVEHRNELVREINGVRYFNDSIASSPSRTIAGLKSFDRKVMLIAGGYDKHIPFEPLAPYVIEKVKFMALSGPTAAAIEKAVVEHPHYNGVPEIVRVNDIKEAVEIVSAKAQSGDIVTLSPACASFDAFPNFEARGKYFKELVNNL
jgi:UDP-N-acetylmuramoylalanine--D-glutamate ligase